MGKENISELFAILAVRESSVRTLGYCLKEAIEARTLIEKKLEKNILYVFSMFQRVDLILNEDENEENVSFLCSIINSLRLIDFSEKSEARLKLAEEAGDWLSAFDINPIFLTLGIPVSVSLAFSGINHYIVIKKLNASKPL